MWLPLNPGGGSAHTHPFSLNGMICIWSHTEVPSCDSFPSPTAICYSQGRPESTDAFLSHQQGQIEVDSETVFKLAALVLQVRTDQLLLFICCFCELPATMKLLQRPIADGFLSQLVVCQLKMWATMFCFSIVCMNYSMRLSISKENGIWIALTEELRPCSWKGALCYLRGSSCYNGCNCNLNLVTFVDIFLRLS